MRLTDADAVKLGGSDVSSIYLGAVAVWGGGVRLAQYTFDTTSQSWAVSTGAWSGADGHNAPGELTFPMAGAAGQGVRSGPIAAPASKKLAISAWTRVDQAVALQFTVWEYSNLAGTTFLRATNSPIAFGNGAWKRMTYAQALGADCVAFRVSVTSGDASSGPEFEVDDVVFTDGDTALDVG